MRGMKEKQILAIFKEPGKKPQLEPLFDNTLSSFQKAVGGYIEAVTITKDVVVICNEDGRIRGLEYNTSLSGFDFYGPIVVVGVKGDEFTSVEGELISFLLYFLENDIRGN